MRFNATLGLLGCFCAIFVYIGITLMYGLWYQHYLYGPQYHKAHDTTLLQKHHLYAPLYHNPTHLQKQHYRKPYRQCGKHISQTELVTFVNYPHRINISCDHINNLNISRRRTEKPLKLYVQSISRLGNVIYEYAALWGIAKQLNRTPVFVKGGGWPDITPMFPNLSAEMGNSTTIAKVKMFKDGKPNIYNPLMVQAVARYGGDARVGTWLESWKYFLPHAEEDLRREFTFDPELVTRATNYRSRLLKDSTIHSVNAALITFVGIHVRRGDKVNSRNCRVPETSYFNKAKDYFSKKYKNVIFVVTGEDEGYLKTNFLGNDTIISLGQSAHFDMVLQGLCNHTIMSVGTYSFWAAWFAGGEAIYFKDHLIPGSHFTTLWKDEDFFLPHWTSMSN